MDGFAEVFGREGAGVAGRFHSHTNGHCWCRQLPIELLGCSIAVVQSPLVAFPFFRIDVRLLSTEPMVFDKPHSTRV